MKFSSNWLSELVEGVELPPQELGRLITMKTAECEGVETVGAFLAEVCAARVVSVEPMGDSHNRKAVVETGRYGRKTVVCAAPNCRAGITSAYVPAGVLLGGRPIGKIYDRRRRERRHAGERRRVGPQPRRRRNPRAGR